jgi:hypothetical protein
MTRDRALDAAAYVVLALLGAVLGVWGAFLVPLRLFGGVEGLADVIGVVSTAAVGYFGAMGVGRGAAAVAPGIGWLVAVGAVGSYAPGGDVVVPGKLGTDPGIGTVGGLYLISGLVGVLVAGVAAGRRLRHPVA